MILPERHRYVQADGCFLIPCSVQENSNLREFYGQKESPASIGLGLIEDLGREFRVKRFSGPLRHLNSVGRGLTLDPFGFDPCSGHGKSWDPEDPYLLFVSDITLLQVRKSWWGGGGGEGEKGPKYMCRFLQSRIRVQSIPGPSEGSLGNA